ncbi:MAG: hypothetical protein A2Y62_20150 [Candidatus Fischerbacteria bacterium RBG_13_37_8]|uniref:Plasmid stabilization protein n=1 Tax=Candidatus Fischerbacteria bacterium RBG_13_37_8 TaxID=1817863 RepID=A0A1F5V5F3_9BACT|nr:MAG: hypothetical protein A2Y62_20150 [Candidatus Fischerbacteria bacterium RBG_13_37_8]
MTWKIKISAQAEKYYKRIDKNQRKVLKAKLNELSNLDSPLQHIQVRPLIGDLKGFYRMRIGKIRIIFTILEEEKIIAIVNILPRGTAY